MPILIVIFTLVILCTAMLIASTSPQHTPAVREGLWAFTRYMLYLSMLVLGPVLIFIQVTVGIMPYGALAAVLSIGFGLSALLLYAVEYVRRDFIKRERLSALARRKGAASAVKVAPPPVQRDRQKALQARYRQAQGLLAKRAYEEAIQELRKLIEIEPEHAEAHQALGNAYNLIGEPNLALQEFQTAFTIRAKKMIAGD